MKKTCNICAGIATSLLLASCSVGTDGTPITINLSEKGADVAPSMYGVFFEEINHAVHGAMICNSDCMLAGLFGQFGDISHSACAVKQAVFCMYVQMRKCHDSLQ
mgnify:CR=1 FL=1